jgi:hypothetical protein
MSYTRDQLLAGLRKANSAGDYAAANEIADELDKLAVPEATEASQIDKNVMVRSDIQGSSPKPEEGNEWAWQAARRSTPEAVGGLAAAGKAIGIDLYDYVTNPKAYPEGFYGTILERMAKYQPQYADMMNTFLENELGAAPVGMTQQEIIAADPTGGTITAGIQGALDPTNIVTGGSKLLTEAFQASTSAMSADIGSRVGGQVDTALGGEGNTGAIVGGLAGGVVNPVQRGVTVAAGATKARQFLDKLDTGSKFVENEASKGAIDLMASIRDYTSPEQLDNLVDNFDKVKALFPEQEFPLLIQLSSNPLVRQKAVTLYSQGQGAAALQQELDKVATLIQSKADTLFGDAYNPLQGVRIDQKVIDTAKKADDRLKLLAEAEYNLTQHLRDLPSTAESGGAIARITKDMEELAVAKLRPKYQTLEAEAANLGVELPPEGTKALYELVKANEMEDLFGKGTKLDSLLKKHLAPQVGEGAPKYSIDPKTKQLVTEKGDTTFEYPSLSFANVVSLKQEINRLQRGRLSPKESRDLAILEDKFNEVRNLLPPEINQRLKAIDTEYYETIGLKFRDSKGVKSLTTQDYVENVAPKLLRPSTMRDFLDVAGPEGIPMARNAVLSELYKKAVNPDGSINAKSLDKFIKDNNELIAAVPDLNKELTVLGSDNQMLLLQREQVELQAKEAQTALANSEALAQSLNMDYIDYSKIARGGMQGVREFLDTIKTLEPSVREAVQSTLRRNAVEVVLNSPDPIAYFKNPTNRAKAKTIFGEQYLKDIDTLAFLQQQVTKMPLDSVQFQAQVKSPNYLRDKLYVDPSYATSTFRDRIMGPFQKGVRLLSKMSENLLDRKRGAKELAVLLEPANLRKLAEVGEQVKKDKKMEWMEIAEKVGNAVTHGLPTYMLQTNRQIIEEENRRQAELGL